MGYESTAEKKRDSALEHIRGAIKDLSEIVTEEASGYADFRSDYLELLAETMAALIQIKAKFNRR